MVRYASITFCYDPDGQFVFPLTVWITEMKTQNLLGMDFTKNKYLDSTLTDPELS